MISIFSLNLFIFTKDPNKKYTIHSISKVLSCVFKYFLKKLHGRSFTIFGFIDNAL